MAIYHFSVEVASRSNGRSAVAMAAYRSGQKLTDERTKETKRYRRSLEIETLILAPSHAPDWVYDRNRLWNAVEKIEKQKNAQLCRHVRVAIPKEFGAKLRTAAVETFCKNEFVSRGMVADIAIYHDAHNPHAHIMLTMRPFKDNGTWGLKARKQYVLDENGKKIMLASGHYKSVKIPTTDWDKVETLQAWRKAWADHINAIFAKANRENRIDHRSLKAQGLRRIPTIHEGYQARQMQKRGIPTLRGSYNRAVKAQNALISDFQSKHEVKPIKEQKTAPAPAERLQGRPSKESIELIQHKARLEAEYLNLEYQKKVLLQERETVQKLMHSDKQAMAAIKERVSLIAKQSVYQEQLDDLKANWLKRLFDAMEKAKIRKLEELIISLDVRIAELLKKSEGHGLYHYELAIEHWKDCLKKINAKLDPIWDRMDEIEKEQAALKIRDRLQERQM